MSGTTNIPGVCVLIKRQGKALFILRAKTGWMDGQYVVPSGHVEDNETFKQAACRETLEEAGITVRPEDLIYKATIHRKSVDSIRIDVWFEALSWSGEPKNMEPEKHSELMWFDSEEFPDNVVDYIRFGLDCITEDATYGEFGWGA